MILHKKHGGNPNWKPGESGNPNGRPRGSRSIAIEIIFKVFSEYGAEEFRNQMVSLVKKNPVAYYLKFVQPIQPKDINLMGDSENPFVFKLDKSDVKL